MNRPYTICHMVSSLNGKISGSFMASAAAQPVIQEYARIRAEMKGSAWLYGTVTTKEFTDGKRPELPEEPVFVPPGDYVADNQALFYYISVDTEGEIGWESGTFSIRGRTDAHVIEVLTESTSVVYRAYLRSKKVSYILAGKDDLDCRLAEEKLYQLFGIRTLIICGGGGVNWSFLQAGAIDELSLLLAPAADGEAGIPSVFECISPSIPSSPAEFALKHVETVKGGGVWLTYQVKN